MIELLVKSIEVPCDQEMAFNVFVDMDSWWPKHRFATSVMRGQTVREVRVEPREGGRIVEVASDDVEQVWGMFKTYDPFTYLNMDFHVPHPSEESPGFSTVEVRFVALAEDRTRVELTQSNWEALGDVAEMVRGGYEQGWVVIFEEAYQAACAARAPAQKRR